LECDIFRDCQDRGGRRLNTCTRRPLRTFRSLFKELGELRLGRHSSWPSTGSQTDAFMPTDRVSTCLCITDRPAPTTSRSIALVVGGRACHYTTKYYEYSSLTTLHEITPTARQKTRPRACTVGQGQRDGISYIGSYTHV
jgi:hypothetical protein